MVRKWIGLLLLVGLVGCNTEDLTPYIDSNFSEELSGIEGIVEQEERIQRRQLVMAEDIVLVTYEVKPTFRVQKQRVERELKKELEKKYPSLEFVVSGDFKLHYEARQLAKQESSNVKKEIEKLKKLAEEET